MIAILVGHLALFGWLSATVNLSWTASADSRAAGYVVVYGAASRSYTQATNVGNALAATVPGLKVGQTYYFACYAWASNGLQSDLSNEVCYQVPGLAPKLHLGQTTAQGRLSWQGIWIDPYEVDAGVPGSNCVITIYRSQGLGTKASGWGKAAAFAWPKTNASILLMPGTWYFRATASRSDFGESPASATLTNVIK
jgi:hypothetical protein